MVDPVKWLKRLRGRPSRTLRTDFKADGVGVRGKTLGFLEDPRFVSAWNAMLEGEHGAWRSAKFFNGNVPDVRWRAHVNCWAAQSALDLPGDFVECGVATGVQARTVCGFVEFEKRNKTFWLFDTYEGIPEVAGMSEAERAYAADKNVSMYFDCYAATTRNFADYRNARLVKGVLPGSLQAASIEAIAYLHIDLNNAAAEMATIAALWDRITPGAFVVLDDYAFRGHEDQYEAWNQFAASKNQVVLTFPTGQGIMIKRNI